MQLRLATLAACTVLCLVCEGCAATPVRVINFSDSEYYETQKDGVNFHCMSDFYVQKVLEAKIRKESPK